jgi:hypothetical protein
VEDGLVEKYICIARKSTTFNFVGWGLFYLLLHKCSNKQACKELRVTGNRMLTMKQNSQYFVYETEFIRLEKVAAH